MPASPRGPSQTVQSAASACGDARWARKLALRRLALTTSLRLEQARSPSERLRLLRRSCAGAAALTSLKEAAEHPGRCHCISATPRPARDPAPPIKWRSAGLPGRTRGPWGRRRRIDTHMFQAFRAESRALGPGRHVQAAIGPDAAPSPAQTCERDRKGVVLQQRAVSAAQNGEVSARNALMIINAHQPLPERRRCSLCATHRTARRTSNA